MKNNYFYKLCKVIGWPVLFWASQFLLLFLIYLVYSLFGNLDEFNIFINHHSYIVGFLNVVILLPVFYKKYKIYKKENNKVKEPIKIILIALLSSLVLNEIILLIKIFLNVEMNANLDIFLLINTIIIGPILEELLFRGIVFNQLLEFNSEKKALIITTVIFAIMHGNLLTMIYTFIMGYILNILYVKQKNLKVPILFHITINFVSSFIIPFIYTVI